MPSENLIDSITTPHQLRRLSSEQLVHDLRLVRLEIPCHCGETRLHLLVPGLLRKSLGPVHRQVEGAAPIVDLEDLARGELPVLQVHRDGLVESP